MTERLLLDMLGIRRIECVLSDEDIAAVMSEMDHASMLESTVAEGDSGGTVESIRSSVERLVGSEVRTRVEVAIALASAMTEGELRLAEPLQFLEYPVGASFGRHIDEDRLVAGEGAAVPVRRLSFSIELTSAAERTGGALVFLDPATGGRGGIVVDGRPGDLVVFPPGLWHEVSEVTSGMRRAIVGWWS